ncbi:hypothetical protein B0H19DRAFT_882990, partial [Mycena capillaripes]
RMEVYNDPDSPNIVATFELPGVKNADITIAVKQGVLLLQGERRPRYRRNRHPSVRAHARMFPFEELRYGEFRRAVRLPPGVDVTVLTLLYPQNSCISASLSDGLLTVSWPRSVASK